MSRDKQGWQPRKPEGFKAIPYFGFVDPFDPEVVDQPIYFTEGEKDVETLVKNEFLALTFGGASNLPPRFREIR